MNDLAELLFCLDSALFSFGQPLRKRKFGKFKRQVQNKNILLKLQNIVDVIHQKERLRFESSDAINTQLKLSSHRRQLRRVLLALLEQQLDLHVCSRKNVRPDVVAEDEANESVFNPAKTQQLLQQRQQGRRQQQ